MYICTCGEGYIREFNSDYFWRDEQEHDFISALYPSVTHKLLPFNKNALLHFSCYFKKQSGQ